MNQLREEYDQWYEYESEAIAEKVHEIAWAQKAFQQPDKFIILDIKTAGLYPSEIVEVAIINLKGETVFHSLVKPNSETPQDAQIHSITNEELVTAPKFCDIYADLKKVVEGRKVLIYNREFNVPILRYCCDLNGLEHLPLEGHCLMESWSSFTDTHQYDTYWQIHLWEPIKGEKRAIADCQVALESMKTMAKESSNYRDHVPEEFRFFLPKEEEERSL